jgi:hypothetical protein
LGCTLYCLLAGRPPFVEPTAMRTLLAHRDRAAVPLHEVRPDVPAELAAVVTKMVAKDPAQRFQAPAEVAEALAPFCKPSRKPIAAGTAADAKRPWQSRGWIVAAGMVVLGLVLGIILLVSTKEGTIEIELNDPQAKVEVKVDGETVHLVGVGKPLTLRAVEHHLLVTGEDFETVSRSFTVKRGQNPVLRVQLKPVPPARNVQYLCDMQEFHVKATEDPPGVPRFARKGNLGYDAGKPPSGRILVNGKESPNGLSICPDSNTYAAAKYRLGKTAQTFLASVALNDSAGGAGLNPGVGKIPTALTFQVFGDGKRLWESKPVDSARNVQDCKVDIAGVAVLELRVDCPGDYTNAQAVWLEPRVELK